MHVPRSGPIALCAAALVAVALSGCFETQLTQEEAEARTETAMESFSAAMSSGDGGSVKALDGSMSGTMDEGEGFGGGDMQGDLRMEWGRGDVSYLRFEMDSGGFSVTFESWCFPGGSVMRWGEDVYEARPSADGDDRFCMGMDDEELEDGLMFLDSEGLEDMEQVEVTINDDGTITAVYYDEADDVTMTVIIDEKGRVSHFEYEGDDASGAFDVLYGSRGTIDVPEANERVPASIWSTPDYDFDSEMEVRTITESPNEPPLDEIEARWVERDWSEDTRVVIYTFSLTGGAQKEGEVAFEYVDVDGDGKVTPGDRYEFTRADNSGEDARYQDLELYDLWAEGYANESPIPAPGIVLVLAALGAVLVFVRRRG